MDLNEKNPFRIMITIKNSEEQTETKFIEYASRDAAEMGWSYLKMPDVKMQYLHQDLILIATRLF